MEEVLDPQGVETVNELRKGLCGLKDLQEASGHNHFPSRTGQSSKECKERHRYLLLEIFIMIVNTFV